MLHPPPHLSASYIATLMLHPPTHLSPSYISTLMLHPPTHPPRHPPIYVIYHSTFNVKIPDGRNEMRSDKKTTEKIEGDKNFGVFALNWSGVSFSSFNGHIEIMTAFYRWASFQVTLFSKYNVALLRTWTLHNEATFKITIFLPIQFLIYDYAQGVVECIQWSHPYVSPLFPSSPWQQPSFSSGFSILTLLLLIC